jgi:hypothetical protein
MSLPFSFTVVDAAEAGLNGQEFHDAKTKNISAGGLLFETGLPLKVGDRLDLALLAPELSEGIPGLVVRAESLETSESQAKLIAVQFSQLEGETGTLILGFLDSKTEEMMKDRRQWSLHFRGRSNSPRGSCSSP